MMANDILQQETRIRELAEQIAKKSDNRKMADLVDLQDSARQLRDQYESLLFAIEDFGILIPVEEIGSMTFYHASIHATYFAAQGK